MDITANAVQMGIDAGVGALTGTGMLSLFVRSAGGGMMEARQAGAGTAQQILYGLASGSIEVATEKMFDGVAKIYGAGLADDVVEKLVGKLAHSDTGRTVLRTIVNASGEGIEEVVSDLLAPFAKSIYDGKSLIQLSQEGYDASQILYDYLIGMSMGVFGGAGAVLTGQDATKNAELRGGENGGGTQGDVAGTDTGNKINSSLRSAQNSDTLSSKDPRIGRAVAMMTDGASPSEIFRETGLVKLANGSLTDGFDGETIWRSDSHGDQRGMDEGSAVRTGAGTSDTGIAVDDEGTTGAVGGEQNAPRKGWTELTDSERTKAREIISERTSLNDAEVNELRRVYGGEDALIEDIYEAYRQGDIVLEQWTPFFGNMRDVAARLDTAQTAPPSGGAKGTALGQRVRENVTAQPTAANADTGVSDALNSGENAPGAAQGTEGIKNTASEETESTAINTDPARHTAAEQETIDAYQDAVDSDLVGYVEAIKRGEAAGRYYLAPVNTRAAADIKALTGVDVSGNHTVLERRAVEHIIKDHGENGQSNQSMRDINDIARIQWVLDNYDAVSHGGKSSAYVTMKPNGKHGQAQTVIFQKAVNGTYYIVEAVPDTAKKTTFVVSAYMDKKGGVTQAPNAKSPGNTPKASLASPPQLGVTPSSSVNAKAPRVTSENAAMNDVTMNSISNPAQNVNTKEAALQRMGAAEDYSGNDVERGFSKNIRTDRSMEDALRQDLEADPEMYTRLSNAETLAKAEDIFKTGFESAKKTLNEAIGAAKTGMKLAPEMVPLAQMVANEMSRRGDTKGAGELLAGVKYVSHEYKPTVTPHQFRHAYASMLDDAGIDEMDAKTILGHSSIVVTKDIYTHLRAAKRQRIGGRLNEYLNPAKSDS